MWMRGDGQGSALWMPVGAGTSVAHNNARVCVLGSGGSPDCTASHQFTHAAPPSLTTRLLRAHRRPHGQPPLTLLSRRNLFPPPPSFQAFTVNRGMYRSVCTRAGANPTEPNRPPYASLTVTFFYLSWGQMRWAILAGGWLVWLV
jgi:hypothetical protein